jgi:preprotein translocase subunit YajC
MVSTFLLNAAILLAQAQEEKSAPGWVSFLPMVAVLLLLYFMIIMPARRREAQQKQAVQEALKKNARVVTTSGIIGTVVAVHDNGEISLKVDDNPPVKIRMLKGSISQVLSETPGRDAAGKPAADTSTAIKS